MLGSGPTSLILTAPPRCCQSSTLPPDHLSWETRGRAEGWTAPAKEQRAGLAAHARREADGQVGQDTSRDLGSSHSGKVKPSPTIPQLRPRVTRSRGEADKAQRGEEMTQPGRAASLVTKVSLGLRAANRRRLAAPLTGTSDCWTRGQGQGDGPPPSGWSDPQSLPPSFRSYSSSPAQAS